MDTNMDTKRISTRCVTPENTSKINVGA
jgi:hypothetical protein